MEISFVSSSVFTSAVLVTREWDVRINVFCVADSLSPALSQARSFLSSWWQLTNDATTLGGWLQPRSKDYLEFREHPRFWINTKLTLQILLYRTRYIFKGIMELFVTFSDYWSFQRHIVCVLDVSFLQILVLQNCVSEYFALHIYINSVIRSLPHICNSGFAAIYFIL